MGWKGLLGRRVLVEEKGAQEQLGRLKKRKELCLELELKEAKGLAHEKVGLE